MKFYNSWIEIDKICRYIQDLRTNLNKKQNDRENKKRLHDFNSIYWFLMFETKETLRLCRENSLLWRHIFQGSRNSFMVSNFSLIHGVFSRYLIVESGSDLIIINQENAQRQVFWSRISNWAMILNKQLKEYQVWFSRGQIFNRGKMSVEKIFCEMKSEIT